VDGKLDEATEESGGRDADQQGERESGTQRETYPPTHGEQEGGREGAYSQPTNQPGDHPPSTRLIKARSPKNGNLPQTRREKDPREKPTHTLPMAKAVCQRYMWTPLHQRKRSTFSVVTWWAAKERPLPCSLRERTCAFQLFSGWETRSFSISSLTTSAGPCSVMSTRERSAWLVAPAFRSLFCAPASEME
jgi:hypothetical protein